MTVPATAQRVPSVDMYPPGCLFFNLVFIYKGSHNKMLLFPNPKLFIFRSSSQVLPSQTS